jgi:hypothetical protein
LPASATNPSAAPAPKQESEADIRRRGEACMARLRARGLLSDGPPGRRKRNNAD